MRRRGRDDGEARQLGELDAEEARRGAAAPEEEGFRGGGRRRRGRRGELEGLVEALALFWLSGLLGLSAGECVFTARCVGFGVFTYYRRDTDTERRCLFKAEVVWYLDLKFRYR